MKYQPLVSFFSRAAGLLLILLLFSACSLIESSAPDVEYQTFTIPAPEEVTFELPEGWDFWGNAGWLSPDDGHTCAGLRLVWVTADQDAARLLFNEDSVVLDQSTVTVGSLETTRYQVEVYTTVAATDERSLQGYEWVYAFPAADPEQLAGVFVSAPTLEELEPLAPIAEHMVSSLKWKTE